MPSEEGLMADSLALFEQVAAKHRTIVVMGRSLGTAVAVNLAARKPVAGLILVTPYSSMVDLARHYYPFLPVGPLLKDRFESVLAAPNIEVPVLILIAGRDEVIPGKISDTLVDSFKPGLVRRVLIDGAGHNTIDSGSGYDGHLVDFVQSLLGDPR
jgi:pimeloyl-ACP methyl ester carboxylesterase